MLEGLPPNGAAHVVRLSCDEATARAVVEMIFETFEPNEAAASAFEKDPNAPVWQTQDWEVEIYLARAPDEAHMRAMVALAAGEAMAEKLTFGLVSERDWVETSLAGLEPVRAGRFVVHGAHSRERLRANDIGLEIEAALAFGTGHHGTTRGCLLWLDQILKERRPARILDVGTGTGVLALAAAKALHIPVESGDIDPIAVEAARANARLNGAGPWLRPVVAIGARHATLQTRAPYDLIFANILAKPLRMLAPSLARLAHHDSDFVLSGLLAGDVAGVLNAWRAQNFYLAGRIDLDGWAALRLRRGGKWSRPGRTFRRR